MNKFSIVFKFLVSCKFYKHLKDIPISSKIIFVYSIICTIQFGNTKYLTYIVITLPVYVFVNIAVENIVLTHNDWDVDSLYKIISADAAQKSVLCVL